MHHSLHELSTFTDKTHAVIPVQVTKVTPRETKAGVIQAPLLNWTPIVMAGSIFLMLGL